MAIPGRRDPSLAAHESDVCSRELRRRGDSEAADPASEPGPATPDATGCDSGRSHGTEYPRPLFSRACERHGTQVSESPASKWTRRASGAGGAVRHLVRRSPTSLAQARRHASSPPFFAPPSRPIQPSADPSEPPSRPAAAKHTPPPPGAQRTGDRCGGGGECGRARPPAPSPRRSRCSCRCAAAAAAPARPLVSLPPSPSLPPSLPHSLFLLLLLL